MNRNTVLEAAKAYFQNTQKSFDFVPGQTYIPPSGKVLDEQDLTHLVEAALDLWLTTGRFAESFERELAKFIGTRPQALLVNSGSSANLLAVSSLGAPMLKALGGKPIEPGSEIITAAAGFPTTVNPILQNGWKPVFVDVDKTTLNVSAETIFTAVTAKTRAIVLAHTLGNPYRADQLREFCDREKIYLVEDCCDALGATINGQNVGTFGDYATLSFYPAHHITTGEGGAVLSNNAKLRRVAESMRDWGRDCWCEPGKDNTCGKRFDWQLGELPCGYDHKYTYSNIGYNLKATDFQASIGLSQLQKAPQFIEKRRQNWKQLFDGIKSSPILKEKFIPVEPTPNTEPSWFGFPLHCASGLKRDSVIRYLEAHKIGTRLLFGGNLTKQPAYQHQDYRVHGELKNTNDIMENTFWIGVYPGLGSKHIAYMLEQLEEAVKN